MIDVALRALAADWRGRMESCQATATGIARQNTYRDCADELDAFLDASTLDLEETAQMIRDYAASVWWRIDENDSAETVCRRGPDMLTLHNRIHVPSYCIGGEHCNPALTEIARRLGWAP